MFFDLSRLNTSNFNNSDCTDVRVTNESETEVAREVVDVNCDEIHFLANISSTEDTIYTIRYGSPTASDYAATDPFGSQNVWISYDAVYHLDDVSRGNDSTGTHDSIGFTAYTERPGRMGGSFFMDSTIAAFFDLPTALRDLTVGTNDYTISCWTNRTGVKDNFYFFVFDPKGWFLTAQAGPVFRTERTAVNVDSTTTMTANEFFLTTARYDRVNIQNFMNGVNEANASQTITDSPTSQLLIGNTNANHMDGNVDECRITNEVKTAAWILATYNNQKIDSTFITVGDEVDLEAVVNQAPSLTTPTNESPAFNNTDIVWQTTVTDPEGNASNVTFFMSVAGVLVSTQTFSAQANGTIVNATLTQDNYTTFQNVSVEVAATDTDKDAANVTNSLNVSNRVPVALSTVSPC